MIGASSFGDPQLQPPNDNGQVANWNATGLTEVSPLIVGGQKTLLLLVSGQSNAANWQGPSLYSFTNTTAHMINPGDGRVYRAAEPLLGADGGLSSLVSMLADKLITNGRCARVIIGTGGAGGTNIAQHTPASSSRYNSHLTNIVSRFKSKGWLSQCVQAGIWIQGEADAQMATTQTQYEDWLYATWKPAFDMGWTGKISVARATWSSGSLQANSTAIRAAQTNAPARWPDMFRAGPDIDAYNNTYRYDNTHLNTAGQIYVSDELLNAYIGPFV